MSGFEDMRRNESGAFSAEGRARGGRSNNNNNAHGMASNEQRQTLVNEKRRWDSLADSDAGGGGGGGGGDAAVPEGRPAKKARYRLYESVSNLLERAVGFLTPGRGRNNDGDADQEPVNYPESDADRGAVADANDRHGVHPGEHLEETERRRVEEEGKEEVGEMGPTRQIVMSGEDTACMRDRSFFAPQYRPTEDRLTDSKPPAFAQERKVTDHRPLDSERTIYDPIRVQPSSTRMDDSGSPRQNNYPFTDKDTADFVRALRFKRGLPPAAAMHVLAKMTSVAAAQMRLELLDQHYKRVAEIHAEDSSKSAQKMDTGMGNRPSTPILSRDDPLMHPKMRAGIVATGTAPASIRTSLTSFAGNEHSHYAKSHELRMGPARRPTGSVNQQLLAASSPRGADTDRTVNSAWRSNSEGERWSIVGLSARESQAVGKFTVNDITSSGRAIQNPRFPQLSDPSAATRRMSLPATAGLGDMDFGRSHLSGRKRAAPSSPFDDVMGRGADRVKRSTIRADEAFAPVASSGAGSPFVCGELMHASRGVGNDSASRH